jgi:sulfite exporter TauE/SafE
MIWTAILLGLAGSLHCVLMCSPLALAVTGGSKSFPRTFLYNAGRVLTYAILGALFAAFGKAISVTGLQLVLAVAVGLTLMLMGITGISSLKIPLMTDALARLSILIKNSFRYFLQRKTNTSILLLGMTNGLLPCGITYLAFTYCLTLAGAIDGFNFMLWFGLGTLPSMLGLTSVLVVIIRKYNLNAGLITRYSYIFLGLIVVARLFFSRHQEIDHAIAGVILLCQ